MQETLHAPDHIDASPLREIGSLHTVDPWNKKSAYAYSVWDDFPDKQPMCSALVILHKGDIAMVVDRSPESFRVRVLTKHGLLWMSATEFWVEDWDGPDELSLNKEAP